MIAQRVIYYFRDLLDIKVTRAAAAWLRLNTDGTVSERTAAQTLGDLGAASVTGANTFTSTSNSFTQPLYLNSAILGVVTSPIAGAYNGNGAGLTGDAQNLIVGYATLAGVAYSFAGTLPITSGGTGGDTAGAARTALKVPASDITGISGASAISNIVSINQTNYNILVANVTTNGSTLYIIV